MPFLAPPPLPPHVALGDNDDLRRVHYRLWQIAMAALTPARATLENKILTVEMKEG